MTLEMKPECESCGAKCPADSIDVFVCSYECTFCRSCADTKHGFVCPNCAGELTRRPSRRERPA